jgi:general secretion pathway protein A
MLSGVETTKEKVLRIILAGQPELNDKLNSQELTQLAQRVRLRFHLTALTVAETNAYIDHRLEVAGSQGRRIFAEDTYNIIYKYTGGVPRLINTLCDTCMMAAFGRDKDTVGMEELQAAIGELQWAEFTSGTNRMKVPNAELMRAPSGTPTVESSPLVGRILLASEGKTLVERELKPGRLVIGRTPDNDLQIDSKFISRHHCQIVTQQDSCLIEDLNSTNGIYVQSKRVRRHNLNDGDVVQVGQHEIMYIDERAPRVRNSTDPIDTVVIGGDENPKTS